jgi:hypothetical protein
MRDNGELHLMHGDKPVWKSRHEGGCGCGEGEYDDDDDKVGPYRLVLGGHGGACVHDGKNRPVWDKWNDWKRDWKECDCDDEHRLVVEAHDKKGCNIVYYNNVGKKKWSLWK